MRKYLISEVALSKINTGISRKILEYFEKYIDILPNESEKNLVHGDFDPANILVDHIDGNWQVSGILDWEFSFSGSVLWDVANMLRYSHKVKLEFKIAFLNGLKEGGIDLLKQWNVTINLFSLLECLCLSNLNLQPNRCADISALILHILEQLEHLKKEL